MGVHIYTAPPPWEVPKKRKTRGTLKGGRDCYDPQEGDIYTLEGEEITTRNRYSPLGNFNDEMEEVLHTFKKPPDSCPVQIKKNPRIVCFDSNGEFFKKNSVNFMSDLFDDCNCMLYTNKYNFCSGYFPDFILSPTIHNADFKDFLS